MTSKEKAEELITAHGGNANSALITANEIKRQAKAWGVLSVDKYWYDVMNFIKEKI